MEDYEKARLQLLYGGCEGCVWRYDPEGSVNHCRRQHQMPNDGICEGFMKDAHKQKD